MSGHDIFYRSACIKPGKWVVMSLGNFVFEGIGDTLQVISIEAEWQMVCHYQLLYISLTLVYEEVGDSLY